MYYYRIMHRCTYVVTRKINVYTYEITNFEFVHTYTKLELSVCYTDNYSVRFSNTFRISQCTVLDLCQIQNSKVERQLLVAVSGSRRARGALIWKLAVCPSRPLILLL